MTASRSIQQIPLVTSYAEWTVPDHTQRYRIPVLREVFLAGTGWRRLDGKQRVSLSKVRALKREGVTAIGVEISPGRVADFRVDELLRRPRQPMKHPRSAGTC
jgi:hypothetical protein